MTPEDIAAVAAGLTEAQRIRLNIGTDLGCICRSATTRKALIRKGLAVPAGAFDTQAMDWTDFGRLVRQHLQERKG